MASVGCDLCIGYRFNHLHIMISNQRNYPIPSKSKGKKLCKGELFYNELNMSTYTIHYYWLVMRILFSVTCNSFVIRT